MAHLWFDLRRAARNLLRSPGFTLAALLSLACGIGANMASFSIVNFLLLRPIGIADPGRLIALSGTMPGVESLRFSWFDYEELRRSNPPFDTYTRTHWPVSWKGAYSPEIGLAGSVSGNYFEILGAPPRIGRSFGTAESEPVAVISDALWRSQFDRDPGIVGKRIWINQQQFAVVGVTPPGFRGELVFMPMDVWVPLSQTNRIAPVELDLQSRGSRVFDLGARLHDGATLEQARTAMAAFGRLHAQRFPDTHAGMRCSADGGQSTRFPVQGLARGLKMALAALSLVVALLLLIACANVAHLSMVRSTGRQGEIAVRMALGSNRFSIFRYLLIESMLLGVLAGLAGLLVSQFILDLLRSIQAPSPLPIAIDLTLDWRVLGFTALVSVATGFLFGLLPAWHASRLDLSEILREHTGAWHSGRRGGRAQSLLVAAQVGLSLILVCAAALALQSYRNALVFEPGFDVRNGVLAKFNLAYGDYSKDRIRDYQAEALRRVRSMPGVESAAIALLTPLDFSSNQAQIRIPGLAREAGERIVVDFNLVSEDYFSTLGIPLVRGRAFEAADKDPASLAAVINQTMASRFWPDSDPIGRSFTANGRELRIVGIAGDGKYFSLTEDNKPMFYAFIAPEAFAWFSLHVRTSAPADSLVARISSELQRIDPDLPPPPVRTLAEHMKLAQYPATIAGISIGLFGGLALIMALTGVYGVMAYAVKMRTHEIGVRIALGAGRGEVILLVLRRGLRILAAGLAMGVAGSLAANRLLSGILVGVRPNDPVTLCVVALCLAAALLLACYLPARRAANLNVTASLRYE